MFSSPSVRLFTSNENMDNVVQRKQGDTTTNHLLSRKPFIDRSVNSKTPDITKSAKDKLRVFKDASSSLKKSPKTLTMSVPKVSPKVEDLNAEDFIYSGYADNYDDNWGFENMVNSGIVIFRAFTNNIEALPTTINQPAAPVMTIKEERDDIDPMFFALPEPFGCENNGMLEVPLSEDDEDTDLSMRTL